MGKSLKLSFKLKFWQKQIVKNLWSIPPFSGKMENSSDMTVANQVKSRWEKGKDSGKKIVQKPALLKLVFLRTPSTPINEITVEDQKAAKWFTVKEAQNKAKLYFSAKDMSNNSAYVLLLHQQTCKHAILPTCMSLHLVNVTHCCFIVITNIILLM